MRRSLVIVMSALACGNAFGAGPDRTISLDEAKIETIRIEGRVQTWVVDKVCIDGQAYLMVLGSGAPGAMSPAFKDGKPEQCRPRAAK